MYLKLDFHEIDFGYLVITSKLTTYDLVYIQQKFKKTN